VNVWPNAIQAVGLPEDIDMPLLYDLEKDIGETTNVAHEFPEIVGQLQEYADEARQDLGDGDAYPGKNCRPPGRVSDPRMLIERGE
jgi:arylsulfatase